jgi:GT2 family glycosyltransferase
VLSIVTLARDRNEMLERLLAGCARQRGGPSEVVVVRAGGTEDPAEVATRHPTVDVRTTTVPGAQGTIPYSAARNHGAAVARGDVLAFCDADTIPSSGFVAAMSAALTTHDALATGEVRYLAPGAEATDDEAELLRRSQPHPDRDPVPADGVTLGGRAELVWGLCMVLRRSTFARLGGFDERFTGYAGEDTDLATRADAAGLPVALVGGATVFHQHHDWFDPPVQQLRATVANATRYHQTWGSWPMEGWLAAFAAMGLVEWDPASDRCTVLRTPSPAEVESCRRTLAAPFLGPQRPSRPVGAS